MSFPPSPGYFSENPYSTPGLAAGPPPGRGMVSHVRTVAMLNAIQGGLELCISAFCIFVGAMALLMRDVFVQQAMQQGNPDPESAPLMIAGIYLALGIPLLLIGLLRLAAALRNYSFLNRTFGIVSLCLGLASTFTGCCSITAIGIAVYGLMVFFNREVGEAFEMRANGASADDILKTFNARPM
jgi:hypothetical protein